MKHLSTALVCSALLVTATGCFEDDTVWLPDSSGVVCIQADGALMHYDLTTSRRRILERADWLRNKKGQFKPAVSPDGKRVAVIRHVASKQSHTVQFVLYNVSDGTKHESRVFALPAKEQLRATSTIGSGRVHWSPNGQRILFHVDATIETTREARAKRLFGGLLSDDPTISTLGVYDLRKDTVQVYDGLHESQLSRYSSLSPFTPDGRGFLAESAGGWQSLVFADWTGQTYDFKLTEALRNAAEPVKVESKPSFGFEFDEEEEEFELEQIMLAWPGASWKGSVAVLRCDRGNVIFDPLRRVIDLRPSTIPEGLPKCATFDECGVAELKDDVVVLLFSGQIKIAKRSRNAKKPTWSVAEVASFDAVHGFYPSPNREYFFVHYEVDHKAGRLILNEDGEVVGDLTR